MFSALPPATGARERGTVPTVLVTSRPPRHRLDYVDQLIGDDSDGQAPGGVALEFNTNPSRAYNVDVIHLTDLKRVIGDGRTPDRERIRRAKRFAKLLRRRKIALVRTVNDDEATRPRSRAETILDETATSVISLTATHEMDTRLPVVIAHSHLRDRFLGFPRQDAVPGRILILSKDILHPAYEATLKVFGVAELPDWTLRIVGKVPFELEDSYARTLADHVGTMTLRAEGLSDAERVSEVSQAEIVVVTAVETYEAQSCLMLALSLNRPVLLEDSTASRSLADEIGTSWVRRYTGPLTAHALESALAELRADPPVDCPNLDLRHPNEISAQYAAVYRGAAGGRR